MTKDDIIRMAVDAGSKQINDYYTNGTVKSFSPATLERFAKLVAAAEREDCAKLCDEQMRGKSMWIEGAMACAAAIRSQS